MTPSETIAAARAYIAGHRYMTLATVSPEGQPMAHTVGYASEGLRLWFMTDRDSRKARNIAREPRVALTVDEDYERVSGIKGVQATGRALIEQDPAAVRAAMAGLLSKFPEMAHMPPNPALAVYRVELAEVMFLDNTLGFGHRGVAPAGA